MTLRNTIAAIILIALASMQFALAQHNQNHAIEPTASIAWNTQHSDHHDSDKQNLYDRLCDLCQISKQLTDTTPTSYVVTAKLILDDVEHTEPTDVLAKRSEAHFYEARGPPLHLS